MKRSLYNRAACAVAIVAFNLSGLACAESTITAGQGMMGSDTAMEGAAQVRLTTPDRGNTGSEAELKIAAAIGLDAGTEEGDAGAADQQAEPDVEQTAVTQDVPETSGGAAESEAAFGGISNTSIAIGIGVAAALAAIGGGGGGGNASTSQHP